MYIQVRLARCCLPAYDALQLTTLAPELGLRCCKLNRSTVWLVATRLRSAPTCSCSACIRVIVAHIREARLACWLDFVTRLYRLYRTPTHLA